MGHWVNTVGDQYKGEFSNDLFEGHGQFTFSNGDIYVGDFRKGEISGFGEYLYLNGEVYKGHFEKGVPEGKGELQKNSGVKVEGNFVAGEVLRDECTVRYDDGRVFRGSVDEKFKANGRGVMEFPSSNIIPGLWTHGIQDS